MSTVGVEPKLKPRSPDPVLLEPRESEGGKRAAASSAGNSDDDSDGGVEGGW